MVNRKVRNDLLKVLGVTKQALSQRAQNMKSHYGPMTTDEAVYVIAHQNRIDLSRYLSLTQIDRVRSLIPKELPSYSIGVSSVRKHQNRKKKISSNSSSYPLVTSNFVTASVTIGSESFPRVFVLENSIRQLIIKILSETYGKDWWDKVVSRQIRDIVRRTIEKELKYPHRQKRGLHPIYYSNFADLKEIILYKRNDFSSVIIDFKWFEVEMDQVYMARNALAHSTLILQDDRDRIRIFYSEWSRLLEQAGY